MTTAGGTATADEKRVRRAGTTSTAAVLILGLTAFFLTAGLQLGRNALDPSTIDRETSLAAVALGLNPDQSATLNGIIAAVLITLCALTTVAGIGVLARREGMRHTAIGIFVVFALITLPLAIAGLLSTEPPQNEYIGPAQGLGWGLAIGLADVLIVWLLLMPRTVRDFERAESRRKRARMLRDKKHSKGAEGSPAPEAAPLLRSDSPPLSR